MTGRREAIRALPALRRRPARARITATRITPAFHENTGRARRGDGAAPRRIGESALANTFTY